jgi:hypothetical protein
MQNALAGGQGVRRSLALDAYCLLDMLLTCIHGGQIDPLRPRVRWRIADIPAQSRDRGGREPWRQHTAAEAAIKVRVLDAYVRTVDISLNLPAHVIERVYGWARLREAPYTTRRSHRRKAAINLYIRRAAMARRCGIIGNVEIDVSGRGDDSQDSSITVRSDQRIHRCRGARNRRNGFLLIGNIAGDVHIPCGRYSDVRPILNGGLNR